ncbi:MAG: nucleotidyl transferase AbiEii/AbiGii toxin family protein, partial [Verrucomicrobia bacterium]|nr:nucleotidyl transferase AbiEii/AbiGii toxin family protein [Verrucomicrobiota bacterium]
MLSRYPIQDLRQRHQALHEIIQQVTLAGLHRGGFFDHAAFYGGTCLRIFHGMPRFSEDMDFSLLEKRDDIHLENYFQNIVEEFHLLGREVVITQKKKINPGAVESAFLKNNTEIYDIGFHGDKTIKVKLELDTHPPLKFHTEQKLLMQPYSFMTRCFTLPDLFAGKMHALVYRHWLKRVKG